MLWICIRRKSPLNVSTRDNTHACMFNLVKIIIYLRGRPKVN